MADALRNSLDRLELDPASEADRPYLVAMLRRLGYSERQIQDAVAAGRMPTEAPAQAPATGTADALAPARDYRLVAPARDSAFQLDNAGSSTSDSPFEDLERVEFEDPAGQVDFEEVGDDGQDFETVDEFGQADDDLDPSKLDTFGSGDSPSPNRTRVRVRRVRASSKEEAERKVDGGGRRVIKSIPVDIVERWGAEKKEGER
jgi:hypothetical protein